MKKITFMLSLLMSMGAMTTSAQVLSRAGWTVTVSGENANDGGGKAAIIDGNNSTYWHSRYNNNGTGDATQKLPQFFVIDLGQETSFKSIGYVPRPGLENGTATSFKLYVSNTEFESVSGSKNAASIVNALGNPAMTGTFTYANNEGQTIKTASSETELTGRYVMFVVTGNKNNGGFASCAEFYLSKDASIAAKSITYHYKVDDTEVATRTANVVIPEEQVPDLGLFTNGAVAKTDDSNYDVTCTSNIPFTAAESYDAATAKWYAIDMHNNQANYLWKGNDDNSIAIEAIGKTTTPSLSDNYQWTFVGNLVDGYKLYNKATNKAAAFSGSSLALSETGDVFKIAASTGSNKANGFCFYKTEGNYLNHQGSSVLTWTSADEGSTMHVQAPESYPLAYAQTYVNYSDEGAPEEAIGANTYLVVADNLDALKTAYNTAASAEGATAEQIKTLEEQNAKVAAGNTSTMEVGKYYRLYNKAHKKYACLNDNPAQVTSKLIGTVNGKGASSVFYIENAEAGSGRYRIKVGGLTLGKVSMSTNIALGDDNYANKGGYVISHVGKTFLFFDQVTGSNYSYIHGGDSGERMVGWEANNNASQWYVIPATDVEIDMTAQGDKKYASAYLPFDVSNVAGATAYTGALNAEKNAIDMTATTAVPANNGFVLVGTEDKATLTIGEATAIAGENALTGTNTGIAFAEATPKANYLVFGVNADKVGFYTPGNVTAIPANKAYINASAITGSAIALNFGNTVTGINAATINNGENNAPIYDLSGRRVWAPVKGGLYIQNGKKLVK